MKLRLFSRILTIIPFIFVLFVPTVRAQDAGDLQERIKAGVERLLAISVMDPQNAIVLQQVADDARALQPIGTPRQVIWLNLSMARLARHAATTDAQYYPYVADVLSDLGHSDIHGGVVAMVENGLWQRMMTEGCEVLRQHPELAVPTGDTRTLNSYGQSSIPIGPDSAARALEFYRTSLQMAGEADLQGVQYRFLGGMYDVWALFGRFGRPTEARYVTMQQWMLAVIDSGFPAEVITDASTALARMEKSYNKRVAWSLFVVYRYGTPEQLQRYESWLTNNTLTPFIRMDVDPLATARKNMRIFSWVLMTRMLKETDSPAASFHGMQALHEALLDGVLAQIIDSADGSDAVRSLRRAVQWLLQEVRPRDSSDDARRAIAKLEKQLQRQLERTGISKKEADSAAEIGSIVSRVLLVSAVMLPDALTLHQDAGQARQADAMMAEAAKIVAPCFTAVMGDYIYHWDQFRYAMNFGMNQEIPLTLLRAYLASLPEEDPNRPAVAALVDRLSAETPTQTFDSLEGALRYATFAVKQRDTDRVEAAMNAIRHPQLIVRRTENERTLETAIAEPLRRFNEILRASPFGQANKVWTEARIAEFRAK